MPSSAGIVECAVGLTLDGDGAARGKCAAKGYDADKRQQAQKQCHKSFCFHAVSSVLFFVYVKKRLSALSTKGVLLTEK